jgi:hypothetical protein
MLERLMSNGARTIIVESPDRFALATSWCSSRAMTGSRRRESPSSRRRPRRTSSRTRRLRSSCARSSAPSLSSRRRLLSPSWRAARARIQLDSPRTEKIWRAIQTDSAEASIAERPAGNRRKSEMALHSR